MPITHFRIVQLPSSAFITAEINGVAVIEGNDYPIADQANLIFTRTGLWPLWSYGGVLFWQVIDSTNNITSEITNSFLSFNLVDTTLETPDGISNTNVMLNSETVLLSDIIDINNAVLSLEILRIEGVDNWTLNGNKIRPNDSIPTIEIPNVQFSSKATGGGDPYSKLIYKVKNENSLGIKEIFNQLNIVALAEIESLSQENFNENITYQDPGDVVYETFYETIECRVYSAHINSTIQLEVVIDSDFLAENVFNKIVFNEEIEKTANETFNIELKTDDLGYAELNIVNVIVKKIAGIKEGDITINLLSVNNNVSLISGVNNSLNILTSL